MISCFRCFLCNFLIVSDLMNLVNSDILHPVLERWSGDFSHINTTYKMETQSLGPMGI